jgi:hypothetical protein
MTTVRKMRQGAAAFLLVAAGLSMAQPASAAGSHNIMVIGSSIPRDAVSVLVSTSSASKCVDWLTTGENRNVGLSAAEGGLVVYIAYKAPGCAGTVHHSAGANVPQPLATKNFWLSIA